VIIEEIFEKKKFLEMIRFFIVFEDQGGGVLAKKWPVIISVMRPMLLWNQL
jgi:type I site-specific restriction-modification system R (restriction) subunit